MAISPSAEPVRGPEDINEPGRYAFMTPAEQEALQAWISANVIPSKSACRLSSYGLKHIFESAPGGFYTENGQFKAGMLAAGFQPINEAAVNWRFKVRLAKP